jgi:drug/metabolite transporter (DMT)-like permease
VRVAVEDIPPLDLAVLRFGQGGTILLLVVILRAPEQLKVDRRDIPFLALLGAIFFSAFPISFNTALQFTEASRGAAVIATLPAWSIILGRYFAGERLRPRQIAGVALTIVGVGVAIGSANAEAGNGDALIGDALMLLTAFLGALYGVLAKRALTTYPALTVTTYAMVIGTALLLPAALPGGLTGADGLDWSALQLVLGLGIFGGALGFFLWTSALSRLSPTRVAVYMNLNPMVAAVLGVLLLSEHAGPVFFIGFVAVVAGVYLVNAVPSN